MAKNIAVIICAAGTGERFGGSRNKVLTDLAGRAIFLRSVELFADRDDVKQIILAISPNDQELIEIKWGANLSFYNTKICHGGDERYQTIINALKLVKDDIDLVAVHDAARCCVKQQWLDELFAKAADTGAAILAHPIVSTVKEVEGETILKTVDRAAIWEAQTPQVFERQLLNKAYANIDKLDKSTLSDDSQLIEALGHKVTVVETDTSNIKITYKSDIAIAQTIIKERDKAKAKKQKPFNPFEEAKW